MTWIKFATKFSKDEGFVGLTVNKTYLGISPKAYEKMNNPERVDVFYDVDKKAIKLVPSKFGRKIAKTGTKYPFLPIRMNRFMPLGRYEYTQDNIFIMDELSQQKDL